MGEPESLVSSGGADEERARVVGSVPTGTTMGLAKEGATPTRTRRVEVESIPAGRRVVTRALRAGRRAAPIHGLVTVDLTDVHRRLREAGGSLTALVVASVARAAAAHPEVHAYRDWRGRRVTHNYVDVAALVEVRASGESFPLAHLIRDADVRSVTDIGDEIRAVADEPATSRSGDLLDRAPSIIGRLPGAVASFYYWLGRTRRGRAMAGTVAVSSIGMFAGGGGFGIGYPTVMPLSVLVGGLTQQPRVVDGSVVAREVLDLTISVDHTLVDGAPAARFVADLRRSLEAGDVLD